MRSSSAVFLAAAQRAGGRGLGHQCGWVGGGLGWVEEGIKQPHVSKPARLGKARLRVGMEVDGRNLCRHGAFGCSVHMHIKENEIFYMD